MPLILTEPVVESTSYNQFVITQINNIVSQKRVIISYIMLKDGQVNPLTHYEDGPDGPELVDFHEGDYLSKKYEINGYDAVKAVYNNIDTEIQGGLSFEEASKKILYAIIEADSL